VSFSVSPDAYDRFMGRYSHALAVRMADFAGVTEGQRAIDVGCGPGALTGELVARLGAGAVVAVDPSEPFARAVRERHPGVEVAITGAEDLPFPDEAFDAALSQLVFPFMADPVAGLAEMVRVTQSGGVVAACSWDNAGGGSPLSPFWASLHEIDPDVPDESARPGAREGDLAQRFGAAGLEDVEASSLHVRREHPSFEDWWEPYRLGVGPAGAHLAGLDEAAAGELRERCRRRLGDGPFVVDAKAWAARGRRGGA